MTDADFSIVFKALTGNQPLSWQVRLFRNHFAKNDLPHVIDLPTGLGKTMVMTIWLIARAIGVAVPRRLIYVVDRRTVVDQATDLAEKLVANWEANKNTIATFDAEPPAISTLRGQLADNREWSSDPTRPAIIIGTVDLIGSALLFSGYRSSFRRRPLEAGLLGQDSLLVLDEAHLSQPFETLLCAIEKFQAGHGSPMAVIRMSATTGDSSRAKPFRLQFDKARNLTGGDENDSTIAERFTAPKTLFVVEVDKPVDAIASEADQLATEKPGSRIVIFVRTPTQVADVRKALEKKRPYATRIAQLTGTMRGLERDELVDTKRPLEVDHHERRVMQRFLHPANDTSLGGCFLISTSAGEVGFDLNADHLIGDEAPLDSWIQRLGRVNRRGKGTAIVKLIKKRLPADKTDFDKACIATSNLFINGMDVSPNALATLRQSLTCTQIEQATSPKPATLELTDILLDAWSMTSIIEPLPGRPEVGPWLRGISEWEPPQTTFAWRAELDLDGFADLDLDDIEEWFDTHRILPHETLSVNTADASVWVKERWAAIPEVEQMMLGARPMIVDRAGVEIFTIGDVVDRLARKTADADGFLRDAAVIIPVSFGGILRGLLDPTEPKLGKNADQQPGDEPAGILKTFYYSIDVADARGRYRGVVEKSAEGQRTEMPLAQNTGKPARPTRYSLDLVSNDQRTLQVVSYVARGEKTELGSKPETLKQHVGKVRRNADRIIQMLGLAKDNPIRRALEFAADWHDKGKERERWQRLLVFPGDYSKPDEPMGKSGDKMRRDPRGYRHEFGSLREFTDEGKRRQLLDDSGAHIDQDAFDLALHLIAVHHGRGRPHFPKGGFDPDCETRSDEIHIDAIQRFARLQRKYGWWQLGWLENLLRCADGLASETPHSSDDEAEGGAA